MSAFAESDGDEDDDMISDSKDCIKVHVKWKSGIEFTFTVNPESMTVAALRKLLERSSGVLARNQKLIGLSKPGKPLDDSATIASLGCKIVAGVLKISMVGSTLSEIDSVSSAGNNKDFAVVNDLALSVSQNTREWLRFQQISEITEFNVINQPREGRKLLVLDLDHTILHFTSKKEVANSKMKRPYMDIFLCIAYHYFDLVFWSQTSWKWIEIKLTELGMIDNPGYKVCFVLDKTSMFSSTEGKLKCLQIIWNKFNHWNSTNTVHVDDLERNFQLNKCCGILIPPYNREDTDHSSSSSGLGLTISHGNRSKSDGQGDDDVDLLLLARYLLDISDIPGPSDLEAAVHNDWMARTSSKILAEISALNKSSSQLSLSSLLSSKATPSNGGGGGGGGVDEGRILHHIANSARDKLFFINIINYILQNNIRSSDLH